jgi:hypothetical protein
VTSEIEYAKYYGGYVYEVVLDDAKIFEGKNRSDLKVVMDAVKQHARSVLESFYVHASPERIDERTNDYDWKRFADVLANRDWQLLATCNVWAKKPRGGTITLLGKQFMIDKIFPTLGFDGFLNYETRESRQTLQKADYEQSRYVPAYGIFNLNKVVSFKLVGIYDEEFQKKRFE